MDNHFFSRRSKFWIVRLIRFCQISPARGRNIYQIMYGQTLDFQRKHQQMVTWYVRLEILFLQEIWRVTFANDGIRSQKPLQTFLWTKSYVPNYMKVSAFSKKNCLYTILTKLWRYLEDVSSYRYIKTTIFHCSKKCGSPTPVTRLKVTKHGRHD